jgi:hypothetical protein
MTKTVRKGDVGTLVKVYVGCDISDANLTQLIYQKPNGNKGTWVGSIVENSYIAYTLQTGDIDIVGHWKLQAYVETLSGKWYGDIASFIVQDRLIEPTP